MLDVELVHMRGEAMMARSHMHSARDKHGGGSSFTYAAGDVAAGKNKQKRIHSETKE